MSVTLDDLYEGSSRTLAITTKSGKVLNVSYDPDKLTPLLLEQLEGLSEDNQSGKNTFDSVTILPELISTLVTSWDLEEKDGSPMPTTIERLKKISVNVLMVIATAIFGDNQVGEANG